MANFPGLESPSLYVMCDLKRHNAKLPAYKFLEEKLLDVFTPMKRCPVEEDIERFDWNW